MLKNSLLIFSLIFNFSIFAQDLTREEALELIAGDTCECIAKDKETFSGKTPMSKKQMALGVCILKSYNIHKQKSKALKNTKINSFEALGEEIGVYMVSICSDDFMSIFSEDDLDQMIENDNLESLDNIPPPPAPKNESDLNIEAKLKSIHNDAISYLKFEDEFSKMHTIIISEQFIGRDLLSKSNIGKDFTVYFKETFYYDLSEDRYVMKKVLKYLELN